MDRSDPLADLADEAVADVARWLDEAASAETRRERETAQRLAGVVADADGVAFAMRFVDRVGRPEDPHTAGHQLASLVEEHELPRFLGPVDRALLRVGAWLARHVPRLVIPLAERRTRSLVGHLVVDAEPDAMARHLDQRRGDGFRTNVNLLGEAVLGEREADRRHAEALRLLRAPGVDYVSVKVSAIVSQLNYWDWDGCVERVAGRLEELFAAAATTAPPTFVNLDMEEYHDLALTTEAFTTVLDRPDFTHLDAGIVLQAYLPDSFPALRQLASWATARRAAGGGEVKIRLVKGANLAMERVEAAMHGWDQAPYRTKAETDANFKRGLDLVLGPDMDGIRIGVASHNLFDLAFARLLAQERQVADRVEFEMLEGMAPSQSRVVRDEAGGLLLYTPVVRASDFDVAISYLIRRLEENAAPENFLHHLVGLRPGTAEFAAEAERFRASVAGRNGVGDEPQRRQDRSAPPAPWIVGAPFRNEPDTDPSLPSNRAWAQEVVGRDPGPPTRALVTDRGRVDEVLGRARAAQPAWEELGPGARREILHRVGDELARRRGDLVAAMIHEGHKTIAQADPEVSEAVDFARYYAETATALEGRTARFSALGVVAVVPPWNFPVAIPAGGALAALAAGNAVVLKPAPETPRCAEIVAECCWAAGVPVDVLQLLRLPDDEVGRHLIVSADAVVLTGAYETGRLFRSWRPDMQLFAETSGKNALVITPNADIDLAVADLVASAFGHSGQKCSAASLAICVGPVYRSDRLRRQLVDAVESLRVGPGTDLASTIAQTIHEPEGKLLRGLTRLDAGEEWLVEPRRVDAQTWTPGIRLGVQPGSWFARTECFGPVLGLMPVPDLDAALDAQNASDYGLTGGIHSLDEDEVDRWLDRVEVGNAYVNRVITGAIVQRQPFGGWKRSSIGPGAKAGGPNYVAQLGTWTDDDRRDHRWLERARVSDAEAWAEELSVDHDPTGLFCEENTFRYRPLPVVGVRVTGTDRDVEVERVLAAAERCGVAVELSRADDEPADRYAARLATSGVTRVRVVGPVEPAVRAAAHEAGVHLADDPVTADGRVELVHYVREQAVSRTRHRYGNLV